MKIISINIFVISTMLFAIGQVHALDVQITAEIPSVDVVNNGEKVTIMRNQDTSNTINPDFAKTSRNCPPYCINPIKIAEGVETLGELEMIQYLKMKSNGNETVLVIDSRTADSFAMGTIPGSINIPWKNLTISAGADPFTISDILQKQFGVREQEGLWDFSNAKTLVLFCNGMWCGQSPQNIYALLKFGYPAEKIKWYRGGMQNWEGLGLTTVKQK